ncbi:protein kinase [Streptomyces sp. NPDC006208]|uniref:protein kinase domain-containing protein n=1 Tax=Streptomyces sp. NPDC006208 TaxID=3156734 RepID=UPI0033A3381F
MGDDQQGYTGAPVRAVGGGRYVLEAPLGEGGMASVHRARDSVLGRTVAVKTLHADLARDPSFRERFRREARAVAALSHTNIVAVHDSGEDSDDAGVVQYIVMEYVRGRPLSRLIQEAAQAGETIPLDRTLGLTAAVLDALECSHRQGLVHRDIKPANVMVTDDGTVKVMDFGIARALESDATAMTRTGAVIGTPQYLSPEQVLGSSADVRSDLYAVGCMLFQMLTGTLPFDGGSVMSVLYQHVQEPAPAPSTVNPAVSAAVDAVVARALSKDPEQRHPSARDMADDIRRIAQGGAPSRQLPPQDPQAPPTWQVPPQVPRTVTAGTAAGGSTAPGPGMADTGTTRPARARAGTTVPGTPGPGTAGPAGANPFPAGTFPFGTANQHNQAFRVDIRGNSASITQRRVKTATSVAAAVVAVIVFTVIFFGQMLISGLSGLSDVSDDSYTPDPRATGVLVLCDYKSGLGSESEPPDLTGMSPEEAKTCADIAGLRLVQKSERGTSSDVHTVIRQSPTDSQKVKSGSTVTVWVSTGGDPRAKGNLASCDIEESHGRLSNPWLTGMSEADARVCADIAGLKVEKAGTVPDSLTPAGEVAKQEPGSSEYVLPGSTVKVWISSGDSSPSP